jgi:hypothetical protein
LIKATLPPGYAAICIKEHGNNKDLVAAAQSYNSRNHEKMFTMVQSLRAKGGLTADEKDAVDKYAYSRVAGDINTGRVSCDSLAGRISRVGWDF